MYCSVEIKPSSRASAGAGGERFGFVSELIEYFRVDGQVVGATGKIGEV